jgi:hypothetical protein
MENSNALYFCSTCTHHSIISARARARDENPTVRINFAAEYIPYRVSEDPELPPRPGQASTTNNK